MTELTTTSRPAESPARRWRIQIFAITWIAYAGFYFTRQAFSVAKVGILEDPIASRELTKSVLGDLDAVYLAAYAVGQFFWGSVADRFGPRVVVLGGLAMSAVAAVFMGLAPALVFFVPLMVVQGLAQSTGWSALCKNVSAFFEVRERGRMLGFWSTNYAFGGLVSAPFVGWVAYTFFADWRVAFFAGAAVVLLVLVLFLLFQKNTPPSTGTSPEPAPEPAPESTAGLDGETTDGHPGDPASGSTGAAGDTGERRPSSLRRAILGAVQDRMVIILGLSYFLLKPARYAILLWGPVIVTERVPDAGMFEAVVVPAAFGIAGVVAPVLIGLVSDRLFDARRIPPCVLSLGGLVVVLALFIPLTSSGSVWLMVLMLALIGLLVYGADSMISCVSAVDFGTSKHAGAAAGVINGCGSVGAVLGGLLPGYLGGTALFSGFAGAALLSCLLLAAHWNRQPARV